MNLLFVVLIPFIGAGLAAWVSRFGRLQSAWMAGGVALAALIALAPSVTAPFLGETLVQRIPWIPALGLDLAFRLDGLGLLFALMILGIGLLVILYARYYLAERDCMGRFYGYLLLFMGSMLGIVLSENLILLLMFWELTSLSSFLLISYWQHREDARTGARMALAVTGLGGLAMLGGFVLLGEMVGSYDLSVVLANGELIRSDPLYTPMLVLILLGAFTKSAQFPFHFWLPHAMAAPTPVSAYLHSATLVKAGVFLLARLFPALSGTTEWSVLVMGAGLSTLLIGAYFALFKHDLKGLLAYSTISHLGLITLLFGIGTPLAAVAGVFHIINHATFKASLFMAAGIIDHECGTRDMRRINGLWRYMPYTGTLAMVAAAAMAGVPLFNGFLSKEMFFGETVELLGEPYLGVAPARRRRRRGDLCRGLFAALHPRRLLQRRSGRSAQDPARAAALDEGAGGDPGRHLPAGRDPAGLYRRAAALGGGDGRPSDRPAGLRSGHLARRQRRADHEHHRPDRRHPHLCRTPTAVQPRDQARRAPRCQGRVRWAPEGAARAGRCRHAHPGYRLAAAYAARLHPVGADPGGGRFLGRRRTTDRRSHPLAGRCGEPGW